VLWGLGEKTPGYPIRRFFVVFYFYLGQLIKLSPELAEVESTPKNADELRVRLIDLFAVFLFHFNRLRAEPLDLNTLHYFVVFIVSSEQGKTMSNGSRTN